MAKYEKLPKLIVSTALIFGALATIVLSSSNTFLLAYATRNADTVWTLDANDSPTNEVKVDYVEKTYRSYTTYGFNNVGYLNNGLCVLYEGGKIQKVNDNGATYGLASISVTFSGSLQVVSMYEKTDATYFTYTLESGVNEIIVGNYFYLEALEDTRINSFTVNYACVGAYESIAPNPSDNLRLTFNKDNYATVEEINGHAYFVLRGNYNETPMNKAISLWHDNNTYIMPAEKTVVYQETSECDVYFNLSNTSIFEDKLIVYYPHISYNGVNANNLVYRIVKGEDGTSTHVAPTASKIAHNGAFIEIKFPNLAGGMVSIDFMRDNILTPYKYYNLSSEIAGKTPSNRLIERERFQNWSPSTGAGYGKGVEYYNGYYYAVRSIANALYIDKISFNGSWIVEASSDPVNIDYGKDKDVGRIFAYDGKIYTFDYTSLLTESVTKLIAFDAKTLERVDDSKVTLSFGGIDAKEILILAADHSEENNTFVVLALSNTDGLITNSGHTAHLYIYDDTNLETPRAVINVLSGITLRDVAIYKDVAEVLASGNGGSLVLQDFTILREKEAWQKKYPLEAKLGSATSSGYNHQALTYNDKGQIVLASASWGGFTGKHALSIFDVGDNVANDSLYNHVLFKQNTSTATIEKSLVKGAISTADYVCQQGAAVTDDGKVYFLLDNAANQAGIVQQIDVNTGDYIGNPSAKLELSDHQQFQAPSNGISYFDGHLHVFGINGKIYRFENDNQGNVDLTYVKEVENPFTGIDNELRIFNVSVDREGRYAVSALKQEAKTTIYVYNSNKELEHSFVVSTGGLGLQSVFGTKDYIYVNGSKDSDLTAWPKATIDVYSYNGSKLYTHTFDNLGNEDGSERTIECLANCPSYFEVNGKAYITVNTWKYQGNKQVYDLYRFSFVDAPTNA